jgi:hypothetical protein
LTHTANPDHREIFLDEPAEGCRIKEVRGTRIEVVTHNDFAGE